MTKNSVLKGVLLVGLGATSYGMLATFVKIAYVEGFTTPEVTIAQFVYGITGMLLINMFQKAKKGKDVVKASKKNITQLMLAGTSLGMTSIFYYLSVKYIPVSIAIVLLMQTVWMGVLFEMILEKKNPETRQSPLTHCLGNRGKSRLPPSERDRILEELQRDPNSVHIETDGNGMVRVTIHKTSDGEAQDYTLNLK